MELFDTGPAVLDSTITFTAIMKPENVTNMPDVWPVEYVIIFYMYTKVGLGYFFLHCLVILSNMSIFLYILY